MVIRSPTIQFPSVLPDIVNKKIDVSSKTDETTLGLNVNVVI